MSPVNIGFFRNHPHAVLPRYETEQAACFDLTTIESALLYPDEIRLLRTGLIFDIPEGYSVRIHPRSSTPKKFGIDMPHSQGIIDSDYVSEVFVQVRNLKNHSVYIDAGSRIAQCEVVPVIQAGIVEITEAPKQKTNRTGGFGSTGG